jgi:hypothetical protein
MAILKNLTAAEPIVRGVGIDPKITLRAKMFEVLTDQLQSIKLTLEGKKFEKTRTSKKRGGEEVTKQVRFRPCYGKNAYGDFVYELKFGNKPCVLPQIKSHVIKCGKELGDVQKIISQLVEALNAGELDAILVKNSEARKAQRKPRNAAAQA